MRKLLLLLVAAAFPLSASAQWTFQSYFPEGEVLQTDSNHGLAVDGDGQVWIQSYYATTGDSVAVAPAVAAASTPGCNASTNNCRTTALHVYNADSTPASFSPVSIVTLPGGVQDTLGGGVIRNGTGVQVWDYNTGRGLTAGPDGNVYASIGGATVVYRFDTSGNVVDFVRVSELDSRGATSPSIDANGNMFITGVFNGDPVAIYNSDLEYVENVVDADAGFNRSILALPDGNTVFNFNYSSKVTTVFQREDEFSAWDSTGIAFDGMAIESSTIHPTTGNIWVSAGSPNDVPAAPWQAHTWYAFDVADALANPIPTPLDSLTWDNPADGRPRAIAFSPDGMTAYVGEFSLNGGAVQQFTKMVTAADDRPTGLTGSLAQNQPNPFSGRTQISFELERNATVSLRVFDTMGREVAVLAEGSFAAGPHSVSFDADALAGGVYFYSLDMEGNVQTRRMMVVR